KASVLRAAARQVRPGAGGIAGLDGPVGVPVHPLARRPVRVRRRMARGVRDRVRGLGAGLHERIPDRIDPRRPASAPAPRRPAPRRLRPGRLLQRGRQRPRHARQSRPPGLHGQRRGRGDRRRLHGRHAGPGARMRTQAVAPGPGDPGAGAAAQRRQGARPQSRPGRNHAGTGGDRGRGFLPAPRRAAQDRPALPVRPAAHGGGGRRGAGEPVARELAGGWPECVGEDIVLSWALLETGARIGYCEDACLFTRVPTRLRQFARQRQRWSRGLMEAFGRHWRLLFHPRMTTLFIWWNLLFLPLDLVYTFAFLPGIVLALFGFYWIVGPMTLLVLPLAAIWNLVIFRTQRQMFQAQHLRVRRNLGGFLVYTLGYTMILQPVCVMGYAAELLRLRKTWGTK